MAYVIAEIGFNHGGDVDLAVAMIKAAARAGANAVKFQSFYASDLYFPGSDPAFDIFKAGELTRRAHEIVRAHAAREGVDFLSTPFSAEWVEFLERRNPAGYKIASMDVNNIALLRAVGATGRRVYLSTGGADIDEVRAAIKTLRAAGSGEVVVFHCVSNYPTLPEEAMLWMIPKLKRELGVRIGFSDHTLGIAVPVKAAGIGAEVIEKHFTTDKSLPGPDHAIAADPAELRALVEALRGVAPGSLPAPPEEPMPARPDAAKKPVMRRGVYAARDIRKGETVTMDMLALVRPEVTPLEKLPEILGKPAAADFPPRAAVTPG